MRDEHVTMTENRELREYVHEITVGCFLTREEYKKIVDIIKGAVIRESKV
jgi:type III secretion system FlhB-like substrate exporter